jgi:predicted nucleotidyltransferase
MESEVDAVWVLGSAVTGRLRDDSDVDLAVLYREGALLDLERVGVLASDVEAIVGRQVDLGRLDTRNLIYAMESIREGVLLYQRDSIVTDRFVDRVSALYFDLKRERKVVEDAYCVG